MISRVVVRSDSGMRGLPVLHYYDFIDFKPEVDDLSIFNPVRGFTTASPAVGKLHVWLAGDRRTHSECLGIQ